MTWPIALGVLIGAGIVSFLGVAASIRLANRWSWYDHPDGDRKLQLQPIPKLGGLAVALALTLASWLTLVVLGRASDALLALAVLGPALGAAVVGSIDDRRGLSPSLRLLLQAILAAIAWYAGNRIVLFGNTWLDCAAFILWVIIVVNGINLLDNSDGLAATTVLIAATGAAAIAIAYGQVLVSLLGMALIGVAVGFLLHNWHPARVYLGDAGAYFLGFMLALLTVRVRPSLVSEWQGALVAMLLLALPIVDTGYVTTRRILRGVHPFTAGRDHLSHELHREGFSVPKSVLALNSVQMICVAAAVMIAVGPLI